MEMRYNHALYQESQDHPVRNAPPIPRESLFSWIESTGRFKASEEGNLPELERLLELDDILDPEVYDPYTEEEQEE